MAIDSFQKRFLMNIMQIRQCFSRAKPFQLKKARFLISKKSQSCSKKPEFQNLASRKKPNWQPSTVALT